MAEEKDDNQIELDVGDAEETEVELEVEQPEESPIEVAASDEDDNFEKASNATQKRIDRLTKKMRTAEREREEAIRYAQKVQTEAEDLKKRMNSLSDNYVNEYAGRIETQTTAAEQELARAIEMGDTAGVIEAQRKITTLAIENDRAKQAKVQQERYAQQYEAQQQAEVQQPMPAQQPRRPDPKAEDWAERNEWFGQDEAMTYAVFGIHKKLVETEGFDPQSDDYYNELDRRMADEFPHKLNNSGESRRPAQTVASVSRGKATGRSTGKVRLSKTQVTMAKKLGVPLEEYAKYVRN
jgi:chromosome segregation ATPase